MTPFGQNQSFTAPGRGFKGVKSGAMGMAVHQSLYLMRHEGFKDGIRIGIHDFKRFAAFVPAAFKSIPTGIEATEPERFPERVGAPFGSSNALSGVLVPHIIGTEKIAMGQKSGGAIKVNHGMVPKEGHSSVLGKVFTHEKIAISRLKENTRPPLGQSPQVGSDFAVG